MEITVLENIEDLTALTPDWKILLSRDPNHTVFQTPEWIISCYECLENKDPLFVITVRKEGRLVGLAPLIIKKKKINGFSRKVLTLIASDNYASDYCNFIIDSNNNSEILTAIFDTINTSKMWDLCDIFNIPFYAEALPLFGNLCKERGLLHIRYPLIKAVACILDTQQAKTELSNHSSLKRHIKTLKKKGNLQVIHLTDFAEIQNYLEAFFEQHINRWRDKAPSLFLHKSQKDFYKLAAERLAKIHALIFTVILFDAQPIAFHFGFEYRNVFYWYKPSFDIDLAAISPGKVLQQSVFEYAVTNDISKFDFTIGDEPYKQKFVNNDSINYRLTIYRSYFDYLIAKTRRLVSTLLHGELK